MTGTNSAEQLCLMDTLWTAVLAAHHEPVEAATIARHDLLKRYGAAVHRYLLGAVRDPDAAADLSQEFALRLLRGDFRRVHPGRGRFRDYIRSVLMNLAANYLKTRRRQPRPLAELAELAATPADSVTSAPTCEECLRDEMLAGVWETLRKGHPRYHAVLQMRVAAPDLSSAELAERLTTSSGESWKADQVRKVLERARSVFVDLVFCEVSSLVNCTGTEDLREALDDLGLLQYCQTALGRHE